MAAVSSFSSHTRTRTRAGAVPGSPPREGGLVRFAPQLTAQLIANGEEAAIVRTVSVDAPSPWVTMASNALSAVIEQMTGHNPGNRFPARHLQVAIAAEPPSRRHGHGIARFFDSVS